MKADVILKEFWQSNERFADLFNTVLFNGQTILHAESLLEADTDMSGLIRLKGYEKPLARTRDVVKKTAHGVDFVICGLENQQRAHYAMPLRALLYDGLGYLKEYRELTGRHRKEAGRQTEEEFLSGLRREDRLHPIRTLVVYDGENPWDG
ncbi:MAG: hypothetical protein LUF34_02105, partial [Lachnospiraceae bacterium]|nr:hypothetical protein [Lachnospiraceae bacterium]